MVMQVHGGFVPHRDAQVTSTNLGPVVDIAAWFIMVAFILAIMMRFAIKRWVMNVALVFDDLLLFLAMLIDIMQVVFVSLSVHYGLGQPRSNLTDLQFERFLKMVYATDLIYFVVAGLAKTSILLLIFRLCEAKPAVQKFCHVTLAFVVSWAVAGTFVVSFQCGSKQPWNATHSQCVNMIGFWEIMGILDILTEIFIVACPLALIWGLSTPLKSRIIVAFAFGLRLWVVAAIIVRLVDIRSSLRSPDLPFGNIYTSIATQCVLGLEIVTACTLVLKPFLHAFDSGMLGISLRSNRFSGVSGGFSANTSRALGSLGQNEHRQNQGFKLDGSESRHMRQFHFPGSEEKETGSRGGFTTPFTLHNAGGLDLTLGGLLSRGGEVEPQLNSYGSTVPLNSRAHKGSVDPILGSSSSESDANLQHSNADAGHSERVQVHFTDGRRPTIDRRTTSTSVHSVASHLRVHPRHPSPVPSSLDVSPFEETVDSFV